MRVCIDPGHGGKDGGTVGNGYVEKNLNLTVSSILKDYLIEKGIDVIMTRSTDATLNETPRTKAVRDSNADICLSIHFNSSNGKGRGTETIFQNNSFDSQRLAQIILDKVGDLGIIKRRAFLRLSQNNSNQDYYFMLRLTRPITSIIIECLFIDNIEDVLFLQNSTALYKIAYAIGDGILEYFGVGSIIKTSIMGESLANDIQMEKYLHIINPQAPYYANIFLQEGAMEGVRGDIAFSQSLIETNYLRFGGVVGIEQNNFAGLGATLGSNGASFNSPREGIRAQIQHLKAYASIGPLNNFQIDPRFGLITRGIAPYVEDLDGKWAVPGVGYGKNIVKILNEILANPSPQDDWSKPYFDNLFKLGIIEDPHLPTDIPTWAHLAAVTSRSIDYIDKQKLSLKDKIINIIKPNSNNNEDWSKPYFDNLYKLGIIEGPHNASDIPSWAELAAVISRTIEYTENKNS